MKSALNFTSDIFHGASFDFAGHTAQSLAEIEALPEVKKLWPIAIIHAAKPLAVGAEPKKISKWDPHVLTKVNEVHKLGFTGKDVVISIIDSGIDYNHPALGGGFGKGFKVEGGWDFVGDKFNPTNLSTIVPDSDPMDCLGHGTHVAGIIASSDKDLPGVAPNARLRVYKVFGCDDGTAEDIMAKAMLKAHEDGADIISASLGSNDGFPENVVAEIITKISANGTFVTGSAGNTGERGKQCQSPQVELGSPEITIPRTVLHKQHCQWNRWALSRERRAHAVVGFCCFC